MPKMKIHRGMAARIKVTGTKKLRREQQMKRHLLEHKSSRRKRRLSGEVDLHAADAPRIKRLLGM